MTLANYDLKGRWIWFKFSTEARVHEHFRQPIPETIYLNRQRVAEGEDLEPVMMIENVNTGEKISVEVQMPHTIDWHERHLLLKAEFPLAATSDFATYEVPYGTIDRPTTRNNSWKQAQFEVPATRWADLGDGQHGFSLLNQTKYGYDAVGDLLRLTLLRAPTSPDPDADQGHHEFHYALYPHAGSWKGAGTVRHGWEHNYPLTAEATTAHGGALPAIYSFVSVAPENVALTAVKKSEDTLV